MERFIPDQQMVLIARANASISAISNYASTRLPPKQSSRMLYTVTASRERERERERMSTVYVGVKHHKRRKSARMCRAVINVQMGLSLFATGHEITAGTWLFVCVRACVRACVCERERERVCVCVCV